MLCDLKLRFKVLLDGIYNWLTLPLHWFFDFFYQLAVVKLNKNLLNLLMRLLNYSTVHTFFSLKNIALLPHKVTCCFCR